MHDANIRVAIAGAGGRMGRQLIQAALALEGQCGQSAFTEYVRHNRPPYPVIRVKQPALT